MRTVFGFLLCFAIGCLAKKTFHGDQVLTLFPSTREQAKLIQNLEDSVGLADFWNPKYANQVQAGRPVDVRFPRDALPEMKLWLNENGVQYQVKISDVQKLVNEQLKGNDVKASGGYNYNIYHPLEQIQEWASDIAQAYPSMVKLDIMGQSFEGRDIQMLTISTNDKNPSILIDCGFHAREWISPAFCQCYTRNLLEGYGHDPTITQQLDRLTFHIIPVVNVDGYKYTWDEDRLWRKTRSNYNNTVCTGVDPNRNCDSDWSGPGSSSNPCAETYYGPEPESEKEVKAVANFMRANIGNITTYVTFHSYSQVIIYPYGYTFEAAETADEMHKYAEQASKAIYDVFGTVYEYGQTSRLLYRAAGGSDDYAYDAGIPLSYTIELRDTGDNGFVLPPDQIEPSCVETTAGMQRIVDAALEISYNSA